jgi:DNA-binding NtrC family response regulator
MQTWPSTLIVDDNAAARTLIAELLRAVGADEVAQASSAEEALDLLEERRFAVIISDYRMEGMDGVAFLEALRARGDRTPMVLLSAAPDKGGVIRATHQEAVDFFPKPFRINDLVGAVERLLLVAA